jgi:hypothetical protein
MRPATIIVLRLKTGEEKVPASKAVAFMLASQTVMAPARYISRGHAAVRKGYGLSLEAQYSA